MKFTHGSKFNVLETTGQLDVFNYTINNNDKADLDWIDNGNDSEGIGIYAFIGDSKESIKYASCYTEEESAFVYILNVDCDFEDLMHLREADEIPLERLSEAVESFIEKLRDLKGANKEKFFNIINLFKDQDGIDYNLINKELTNNEITVLLDQYSCPSYFEDQEEWLEAIEEHYNINEPCSVIYDEGGPECVADYAISKSDNLWETLKYLGQTIAIQYGHLGTEKFNKLYQETILEELADYNLTAAYVNNNKFAVIFDTSKIEIERIIDIKLEEKKQNINKLKI